MEFLVVIIYLLRPRKTMKIHHISDIHCNHDKLVIPDNLDFLIVTGDVSNVRMPGRNEIEVRRFLTWFHNQKATHKVFVPGNHDSSIESGYVTRHDFENLGMHFLDKEGKDIGGLKFWAAPDCPRFGDWSYMRPREEMYDKVWQHMPEDIDILMTHSPPSGQLDLTDDWSGGSLVHVGCEGLMRAVMDRRPKLHCFGHIHSTVDPKTNTIICNSSIKKTSMTNTVFSNGSVCMDSKMRKVWSHGNTIDWNWILSQQG